MTIILILLNNNKLFLTKLISYSILDYIYECDRHHIFFHEKTCKFNEWLYNNSPKKIIKEFDELDFNMNDLTIKYMINYGIENVRSDVYKDVILNEEQIKKIKTDIEKYNNSKNKPSPYFLDTIFGIPYDSSDDNDSDIFDEDNYSVESSE